MGRKKLTLVIIVGIVAILSGIGLLGYYGHWRNTYAAIETHDFFGQLAVSKKNDQDITILFHRTGCDACEKAEKRLVPAVRNARANGKTVLVIDVANLNTQDTNKLKAIMPSAFNDNRIPTPQILKLKVGYSGNEWEVQDQSSLTTLDINNLVQMLRN